MAKLTLKIKILIGCAAAAVIGAAVALVLILTDKTEAYRVLKIFELTGTAIVDRADIGELDAYVGMNLENGDSVSVADNSTARISLDSDKFILLDSGTVMELIAEGTETDSKTIINLVEGTILNEITEPLSENSTYEVNTPKATMAVRGTSYEVSVTRLENGSYITELNVLHGTVSVTLLDENGAPKGESVAVSEGFAVAIITDPNGETDNDASVDGNSYFVIRSQDENGNDIYVLPETDVVVYPIDYESMSSTVIAAAAESNELGRLPLSVQVLSGINALPDGLSNRPHSFAGFGAPDLSGSGEETPADIPDNKPVPSEPEESIPDNTDPDTDDEVSPTDENIPADSSENDNTPADNTDNESPADEPEKSVSDESPESEDTTDSSDDDKTAPAPDEGADDDISEDDFVMEEEMFIDESDGGSDDDILNDSEDSDIADIMPFYPPVAPNPSPVPSQPVNPSPGQPVNPEPSPDVPEDDNTFTVTFYDENNSQIASVSVKSGGTVPAESFPELTAKDYYTEKWMSGDFEFTASTVISADTEVSATYEPVEVTIQIQRPHTVPVDTWDVKETFTARYGDTIGSVLSESSIRAQFDSIYDSGESTYSNYRIKNISVGSLDYSESIVIDESILYTAEDGSYYIAVGLSYAKKYNVSFTDTSGNTLTSYSVWEGESLSGYAYPDPGVGNKWVANINFSPTEILVNHVVNSDINAVLTPITYHVSFYGENGTSLIDQIEVGYNQTVTPFPTVPAKDGYTGRWIIYETSDEFTADTIVASDMVVIAEYTAIP